MIGPTRHELDALLAAPRCFRRGRKDDFMVVVRRTVYGAAGVVRMYAATGDRRYITYPDEEWAKTSDLLYDKQEHLYARDADYLTKTEANGRRCSGRGEMGG